MFLKNYLFLESELIRFDHIKDITSHIETLFKNKPTLEREIQQMLIATVSQLYHASLNNNEGYCIKFQLPMSTVNSLYKKLGIVVNEVEEAFRRDWMYPKNAHMYSDSYYQVLLLIIYIGLMRSNKSLVNNAFLLILIKLWNGRRQEFLPYCNPNIMRYVITNMLNNKFHAAKYDTPLALLANYFIPTLLLKYSSKVKESPQNLKILFSQSYARIFQLFYQQPKINPLTGKKEATSGLSALYYKAHNEGSLSKNTTVLADKETGETSFDQYSSAHIIDEIVNSTVDYIILNKQTTYPDGFVNQMNRLTHVSSKVINQLAVDIHSPKYHDYLVDLLPLILSRLNVKTKNDICSPQLLLDLKKKVISSKNNADSKKIVSIIDILLDKLFKDRDLLFNRYSTVQRIQIRTVLIHIIIFNLKKVVCHQQATQQINFLNSLKPIDILG